jgi:hypothetical protein
MGSLPLRDPRNSGRSCTPTFRRRCLARATSAKRRRVPTQENLVDIVKRIFGPEHGAELEIPYRTVVPNRAAGPKPGATSVLSSCELSVADITAPRIAAPAATRERGSQEIRRTGKSVAPRESARKRRPRPKRLRSLDFCLRGNDEHRTQGRDVRNLITPARAGCRRSA